MSTIHPQPVLTTSTFQTQVAQQPSHDLHAKLDKLAQLILASYKQSPYVPPHARKLLDLENMMFDGEVDDDHDLRKRGKVLTTTGIPRIYTYFQATLHGDKKLNIPEFNGEHNGDVFIVWLLEVDVVFDYKQFRDPKRVQLTETKLRIGAMH